MSLENIQPSITCTVLKVRDDYIHCFADSEKQDPIYLDLNPSIFSDINVSYGDRFRLSVEDIDGTLKPVIQMVHNIDHSNQVDPDIESFLNSLK